jgi:hypothetical protein
MLWWEWSCIPLYLLQIIALFGFVYRRRIATPLIWKLIFLASVAYEFSNLYEMAFDSGLTVGLATFFGIIFVVVYLIQLPLWLGFFLYAFRCKELWVRAT